MFRVLVNRFHKKSPEVFLKSLPKEVSLKALNQEVLSEEASLLVAQPEELLSKIHYSWLLTPFEKISDTLKPSVLSALNQETAEGIAQFHKIEKLSTPLAIPIKRFLVNTLYQKFEKRDVLPIPFLPQTALSSLSEFSKKKLILLIDFLGLYDLSEELRHIVDKTTLKNIYSNLSIQKQKFLQSSLHQKEKLVAGRLDIDLKSIDKRKLESVLHKRGILRLAKALSGEHPDLLWHIAHTLDSGRGNLLLRYYKEEAVAGVTSALALQVINVINFLKKSET